MGSLKEKSTQSFIRTKNGFDFIILPTPVNDRVISKHQPDLWMLGKNKNYNFTVPTNQEFLYSSSGLNVTLSFMKSINYHQISYNNAYTWKVSALKLLFYFGQYKSGWCIKLYCWFVLLVNSYLTCLSHYVMVLFWIYLHLPYIKNNDFMVSKSSLGCYQWVFFMVCKNL